MQAQLKRDETYADYLTSQDLTQYYGRINRANDDFGITFILDDHIEWFIKKYEHFFPQYFLEAFQRIDSVIDPPDLQDMDGLVLSRA